MELTDALRQKVAGYSPDTALLAPIRKAPLLFLSGIAGAGKDSTLAQLLATYPNEYSLFVSHVTRPIRQNNGVMERDGVEYHFINFAQAERLLDTHKYIEADIYVGNIYGTTIVEVKRIYDLGKIAVNDVTVWGAGNFVKLGLNARPVFLLPPNYHAWRTRLEKRGKMPAQELKRRLETAVQEITYALSVPFFYFVINDDLENTAKIVNHIGHGEAVDRHYPAAVHVAEDLLAKIKAELQTITAADQ